MSTPDLWHEPMQLALAQARAALATADVPVGAVVLSPSGDVIGVGRNVLAMVRGKDTT